MSTTAVQFPQPPPSTATPGSMSAEAKTDPSREYIILKRTPPDSPGGNERFEKVAVVRANSNDQAVRLAVEAPGSSFLNTDGPTTLVAVPERSFSTITVEVETTTRVKLS